MGGGPSKKERMRRGEGNGESEGGIGRRGERREGVRGILSCCTNQSGCTPASGSNGFRSDLIGAGVSIPKEEKTNQKRKKKK